MEIYRVTVTLCNTTEDLKLQQHRRENLKYLN
jgi:hypothetical protein